MDIGDKVVLGPAEIEVDEATFKANRHKLEAVQAEEPAKKAKPSDK